MVSLIMDFNILIDFLEKEPKSGVMETDKQTRQIWYSLWDFIQSGSDLILINVPQIKNDFQIRCVTKLTENRGKAKISLRNNFVLPYKCKFDADNYFQTIFFLSEDSEELQKKYTRNNAIPIVFKHNYLMEFKRFAFINEASGKSVRKEVGTFNNWSVLTLYLNFLTDVIIADNYIFSDPSLIDSNLISLLKILYSIQSNLNLTIISFDDPKNSFDLEKLMDSMKLKLKENGIRESFNLVLLSRELKEHDRGIFTNFVRIKSGDSFNFFNSNGQVVTKGTELDFYSLTNPNHFELTEIVLNALEDSVNKSNRRKKQLLVKNRFFDKSS
jgi:hypothetical protein